MERASRPFLAEPPRRATFFHVGELIRYSSGGAGGYGSHASGSDSILELCGDGRCAFESRAESYISIEGASAERVTTDAHAGRWRFVSDRATNTYLILEATDGRVFTWPVEENRSELVIDGTTHEVASGSTCH